MSFCRFSSVCLLAITACNRVCILIWLVLIWFVLRLIWLYSHKEKFIYKVGFKSWMSGLFIIFFVKKKILPIKTWAYLTLITKKFRIQILDTSRSLIKTLVIYLVLQIDFYFFPLLTFNWYENSILKCFHLNSVDGTPQIMYTNCGINLFCTGSAIASNFMSRSPYKRNADRQVDIATTSQPHIIIYKIWTCLPDRYTGISRYLHTSQPGQLHAC